jgi:hypothetical protein
VYLSTQTRVRSMPEAMAMRTTLESQAQYERLMRRSLHRLALSNGIDVRSALDALDSGVDHPLLDRLASHVQDLQRRIP